MVNHVLDVWVRVVPDGWGDGGLVWGGRHTGGQPVTVHIDTLLNRVQLSQWETQTITQHLENIVVVIMKKIYKYSSLFRKLIERLSSDSLDVMDINLN